MAVVAPMVDEYRQLSGKSTTPLVHDIVCAHTMVGTLEGSISWSSRDGGSYWHFGLGGTGKLVQCQDLRYRSAANLNGNWHVIPIETADIKEGVFADTWQDPPWTQAQIDKLVELIAWLCVRYNIPPVLIPDTKPGRRGLAYHRQGINPWRVDGGELWSKSDGKTCPAKRADQFKNEVVPGVRALVLGDEEFHIVNDEDKETLRNIIRQELKGSKHAANDGMTPIIREEVRAVVEEMMSTPGSVVRKEGRVLARLGTEDALKADTPPS